MSPAPPSLWDWALEAYRRPGAEAALLSLQDEHGQCVPLLLWAIWAAGRGGAQAETLNQATAIARAWDGAVITPLRAARRGLKASLTGGADEDRAALRTRVKADELAAERLLLEALESLCATARGEPTDAVSALRSASAAWGDDPAPNSALERLVRIF